MWARKSERQRIAKRLLSENEEQYLTAKPTTRQKIDIITGIVPSLFHYLEWKGC